MCNLGAICVWEKTSPQASTSDPQKNLLKHTGNKTRINYAMTETMHQTSTGWPPSSPFSPICYHSPIWNLSTTKTNQDQNHFSFAFPLSNQDTEIHRLNCCQNSEWSFRNLKFHNVVYPIYSHILLREITAHKRCFSKCDALRDLHNLKNVKNIHGGLLL